LRVKLAKVAEESAGRSFFLVPATIASTVIGAIVVRVIARLLRPSDRGLQTRAKENAERRGTGADKVTELETSMDISVRVI
jgi:hypothetical protein